MGRADGHALHVPLDAFHGLAVLAGEGEGLVLEHRGLQRQLGAGGEVAEGELDGLVFLAEQVALAEVFGELLDVDGEVLRVGQVGKDHHGGAAVVSTLTV